MSTLSTLTATGWLAVPDSFVHLTCDVCQGEAVFTRMRAPECNVTALAGVGASRSDVYGIYCASHS